MGHLALATMRYRVTVLDPDDPGREKQMGRGIFPLQLDT